ncbi:MAG: glutaredoxin domain-containing protein [Candidatus Pacearchaeota archaeon]
MTVKIYSTQTCPWCKKAKEFMKENRVKFTDVDVGKDRKAAQEMVKKSNQMGVPVIDVNGKIIVGFNESELKKSLKLK